MKSPTTIYCSRKLTLPRRAGSGAGKVPDSKLGGSGRRKAHRKAVAAMEEALAFLVKVTRRTQTGVALGYSPR